MTKEIEAVYEKGMIRPLQPLELPEGARLDVIVITHEQARPMATQPKCLRKLQLYL